MKLERLHEHLTTATAVIIGGLVSYWFGLLAGEGSVGTIMAIIAGFALTGLLLALRKNAWVLLPLAWPFGGMLPMVPFHPALHDVVLLVVLAATFMLMAVKLIRFKPQLDGIGFWVGASILYLIITWVRHPTGGLVLQSDRIGGRAYINTAVAFAAYFVLSRAWIPKEWDGRKVLSVFVACELVPGVIMALTAWSPRLSSRIGTYYGGVDTSATDAPVTNSFLPDQTTHRLGFMQMLSYPFLKWMLVNYRPLTLLNPLYAGRAFFFALCLLATMMAGFRSALLSIAGLMLIASYLRRGPLEAARLIFIGMGVVVMLMFASYVIYLPLPVQRTLSMLPGRWDPVAVAEAAHSTEWRLYMWRLMLGTDRYIENKWLGDGFGFSRAQFEEMNTAEGEVQTQENFLIVGQVHSGPITAIRYVGYLGLGLYLCLLFTMAREAFRLCRLTMHTDLGPLTWFCCVPLIWEPFNYLVIFGSYDSGLPAQIFGAGMLKMLRRSVEAREPRPELPVLPLRAATRVTRPSLPAGRPRPVTVPLP